MENGILANGVRKFGLRTFPIMHIDQGARQMPQVPTSVVKYCLCLEHKFYISYSFFTFSQHAFASRLCCIEFRRTSYNQAKVCTARNTLGNVTLTHLRWAFGVMAFYEEIHNIFYTRNEMTCSIHQEFLSSQ